MPTRVTIETGPKAAIKIEELTPRRIVEELDKHIVGQGDAKKAVAVALRNRWRRQQLPEEERQDVTPKNILMIGPTGVGKTEIARRLARLVSAPFLKVEATKYTEVGYVGKDVETIIRDLTEISVGMVKKERMEHARDKAVVAAEERLLDLLSPSAPKTRRVGFRKPGESPESGTFAFEMGPQPGEAPPEDAAARDVLRSQLRDGKLEDKMLEMDVKQSGSPSVEIFSPQGGMEGVEIQVQEMFKNVFPQKTRKRKVTVGEARRILEQEEAAKLIDMEDVTRDALARVQEMGIVFLDELDKVAGRDRGMGPDVSREGVQRDILPIIEGTSVNTKYGVVKTDHILFIAAGAFHVSKPSDLIPEMQGRFPIRVELDPLSAEDFVRILTEPQNALLKQYTALLSTEGVSIEFTPEAIHEIANTAALVNERTENIGARRLHTVMTTLLEDILFSASEGKYKKVRITPEEVQERLSGIVQDQDLSRYIL